MSQNTESSKASAEKKSPVKVKAPKEEVKKTVQKITHAQPTNKLDHLKMDLPDTKSAVAWASAKSFNAAVDDLTKVECYICGGPGHFMEDCFFNKCLSARFSKNGLR